MQLSKELYSAPDAEVGEGDADVERGGAAEAEHARHGDAQVAQQRVAVDGN